jgi:hypothetical protein
MHHPVCTAFGCEISNFAAAPAKEGVPGPRIPTHNRPNEKLARIPIFEMGHGAIIDFLSRKKLRPSHGSKRNEEQERERREKAAAREAKFKDRAARDMDSSAQHRHPSAVQQPAPPAQPTAELPPPSAEDTIEQVP